ncbi:MAG TPA: 3'-5' exonuclease [bacterium]|nr:3'-5' exonuclease [bacterium]HPG44325.1 3'-5' exonuclease [bacterium]HPM96883.1 3'-5' exonuclease [bacterium]
MKTPQQQSLPFDEAESSALLAPLELNRPLVFFDLETTGLDFQQDRIVQFAFIKIKPDRTQQEWSALVNPEIAIPPAASQVHGITDADVADQPTMSHFAPQIVAFLRDSDLAGFNIARFDVPFLQTELNRCGCPLEIDKIRLIDVQVIFHKKEPRDLTAALRFYCQKEHNEAHDALGDVRATVDVFHAQLERYTDLPHTVAALHRLASGGTADWLDPDRKFYWKDSEAVFSFGKHRGRSLSWVQENDIGYLQWLAEKDFSPATLSIIAAAIEGEFPERKNPRTEE